MPELPEVETSRKGIAPYIENARIKDIVVRNIRLRWPVPVDDIKMLIGEKVSEVSRRGKYIKIQCATGYILIHLGMSGSLRVLTSEESPKKHDHIDLIMNNGAIIRFNDPRRFGCCLFQAGTTEHTLLSLLGPEPLEPEFDGQYLYKRSRNKKQTIKAFIMDSHVVVGVGNIYAAEALFKAGIHPSRAAGNISLARYDKLAVIIKTVLAAAIQQGGTTLRNFVDTDGKPGYFKQQLLVYGRTDQSCYQCDSVIKVIKQAQRSTFYCPNCQK
jgi:formamidopyrimidine-DNA glycosylase